MDGKKDWKTIIGGMAFGKQQLLVMLLVGILLVVIALPARKPEEERTEDMGRSRSEGETGNYITETENRLREALRQAAGVGRVEVMITLKSTAEKVIEKDGERTDQNVKESDAQGGERQTTDSSAKEAAIYTGADGNQTPYVKKEMTPEVEGVIVIAEGGDNPEVKKNITEAVQALFDVDTHKIKIMKMNQRK